MTNEERGIFERLLELADEVEKCQDKLRRLGRVVPGLKMPIARVRSIAKGNLALRESVCVMDVVTGKVMKALGIKEAGK